MAVNTTTHGNGTVTITGWTAEDWEYDTDGGFDSNIGIKVSSIQFIPSQASDRMVVHDGGEASADLFDSGLTAGVAPIFKNFDPPKWARPWIDYTDIVVGTTGAKVIIDYV